MKKCVSFLLCLLLVLACLPAYAAAANVVWSSQNLTVNGRPVECEKYNIDGSNYFKLRDIAYLLSGTVNQFEVGYDPQARVVTITSGLPYTPNGEELIVGMDKSSTAVPSTQSIVIDGVLNSEISAYNLGGNNFFKLRDLGNELGFTVDYDKASNTAIILSAKPAPESDPADLGNVVTFGAYEQDNNSSNGKESVEWIVLAKDGEKRLLISKKVLDLKEYSYGYSDVTWETSPLREWLNDEFITTAFSDEEQGHIAYTSVKTSDHSVFHTEGGGDTTDRVFLLSIEEIQEYFSSAEERQCPYTTYVYSLGRVSLLPVEGCCPWWLRSPGSEQNLTVWVNAVGAPDIFGTLGVNRMGVRPALWVESYSFLTEPEAPIDTQESSEAPQSTTLTVALSPDFKPLEYVDVTKNGQEQFVGFDVMLASFIAAEMGLTLVIKPMSFEACQVAVQNGSVDMSISGYAWKEERAETYNLSNFYYPDGYDGLVILLRKGADEMTAKVNEILVKASAAGLYSQWSAEAATVAGADTSREVKYDYEGNPIE